MEPKGHESQFGMEETGPFLASVSSHNCHFFATGKSL